MEARELYRQKYEARIHEWEAKVAAIKAHAEKMTAEARLDLRPHVDAVHGRFEAVNAALRDVASATEEKWDEVQHRAESAWGELKAAVEGASDAIKASRSRD